MLKDIPQYNAPSPLALALDHLDEVRDVLVVCRRLYTKPVLRLGDHFSNRWLKRADLPYEQELRELAAAVGEPGILALNLSYEWGCTTGFFTKSPDSGPALLHTLDWPVKGLGEKLVFLRCSGPAGEYWSLTHPGFLGAHSTLAPGRFAAALNQAPIPRRSGVFYGDWLLARLATGKLPHTPATFLLRQAAETCADFESALALLTDTPLCIPAIFTIAGAKPGEYALIERDYRRVEVYRQPAAAANHWQAAPWRGHDRPEASRERLSQMAQYLESGSDPSSFDWLTPPILNAFTRMAVIMRAGAQGGNAMRAVAVEEERAVTEVLSVEG